MEQLFRLILILFISVGCQKDGLKEYSLSGEIFGTYYRVKGYSKKDLNQEQLKKEIDQYLSYLDLIFSTYKSDSELSKLNIYLNDQEVAIGQELYEVLKISRDIFKETKGYFDITVGPIVNAWGFGPDGVQKQPIDDEIKRLSNFVGMDKLKISSNQTVLKREPKLYIDLSAIAKGYAVDKLAKLLEEKYFKSFIVEIGGEVKAIGLKDDKSKFRVGIERPEIKQTGSIMQVVELQNKSLATSGSYRNFKKYQDQVFSHTINPLTFKPAMNKVISVSVLHESCTMADAYATAFMAMGAEKSLEFANNKDLAIYILMKNGEKIDILTSNNFPIKVKK
jgi:thiamine biosynthesis lipoprotein